MKKIMFSILMLSGVAIANAQEFKPFKVDVSTGYAIPSGDGAKGGVLFVVEPKYAVIPNLSLGLRMEIAVMARGSADNQGNVSKVDVKGAGSYLATGDYYFTSNTVRPFAGAGVGLFSLASATVDENTSGGVSAAKSKFGGMLRAGAEIGHFRVGVEYNLVGNTDIKDMNNATIGTSKNSYIGIKLGAVIGGGRIRD